MIREEKLQLLEDWRCLYLQIDQQATAFHAIVGGDSESPLMEPVWRMFDQHTDLISKMIGDENDRLSWFCWTCEMGRNPKKASPHAEAQLRTVGTTARLLELIEEGLLWRNYD